LKKNHSENFKEGEKIINGKKKLQQNLQYKYVLKVTIIDY